MKYLTLKDVLLLHHLAIEESGGSHGVRDVGLIESAVFRPQSTFGGKDLYPDVVAKAAVLCHSLIKNHAFIDGNKRTSLFSVMTFLELNGWKFVCEQKELVEFGVAIDNENIPVKEIKKWLKRHCIKQ